MPHTHTECHYVVGIFFRYLHIWHLLFDIPTDTYWQVHWCDAGKDFRLSINSVWYCRVLLLFSFHTSTDSGIKRHDCAFVSLLWEYDEDAPGTKLLWTLLNTSNSFNFICFRTEWLLDCRSRIVYERKPANQVFYVLPVESILGKLPVVPVAKQERFHLPCDSTRRIFSALHSIQGREPVTVAGGGMSIRGPWAGRANAAKNEEIQPPILHIFETII